MQETTKNIVKSKQSTQPFREEQERPSNNNKPHSKQKQKQQQHWSIDNDEAKVINSAHPTPFAIWSSAYEQKQAPPSPTRRLNVTQSEDVADRLYDSCRIKYISSLHKATRVMAEDLCELSFTPAINNTSRKIARMIPPLHERLDFVLKARTDRIERRRKKLEERDMAEVTCVPQTNTGKTTWVPRVRKNYTNSSNALAEGMLAEEAELTFSPRINEWSRRLCERARAHANDGGDEETDAWNHGPRRFRVTGTCEDPGHHEETFHPVINHRSRFAVKDGHDEPQVSAFERLYELAMQKEAILGRRKHNTRVSEKANVSAQQESNEMEATDKRNDERSKTSTAAHVVQYSEECDEVLRIVRAAASARENETLRDE